MRVTGRPVGNYLFLGPTGSGKTRIVKAAVEILFGDPRAVIKADCGKPATKQRKISWGRFLCQRSELELESELDRARAADLVEGVETAIRATRPQAARQRLCRVAEQGAG